MLCPLDTLQINPLMHHIPPFLQMCHQHHPRVSTSPPKNAVFRRVLLLFTHLLSMFADPQPHFAFHTPMCPLCTVSLRIATSNAAKYPPHAQMLKPIHANAQNTSKILANVHTPVSIATPTTHSSHPLMLVDQDGY
jgi:hypothetical protein